MTLLSWATWLALAVGGGAVILFALTLRGAWTRRAAPGDDDAGTAVRAARDARRMP